MHFTTMETRIYPLYLENPRKSVKSVASVLPLCHSLTRDKIKSYNKCIPTILFHNQGNTDLTDLTDHHGFILYT